MKGIIEIAIGKRHPLFSSEGEGARCDLMLGEAPLCLAVFAPDLTAAELKPVRIRLGLLAYHLSIFLVLDMDGGFVDMPYFHPAGRQSHQCFLRVTAWQAPWRSVMTMVFVVHWPYGT